MSTNISTDHRYQSRNWYPSASSDGNMEVPQEYSYANNPTTRHTRLTLTDPSRTPRRPCDFDSATDKSDSYDQYHYEHIVHDGYGDSYSSITKSYVPPFARGDFWRPSYSDEQQPDHGDNSYHKQANNASTTRFRDGPTLSPPKTSPTRIERVMPKDFKKPMTCFYWATQGHCLKSDQDCWYAHHWTGIVAAAPVRFGDGGAVAGKVAERAMDEATMRAQSLDARESALIARESSIASKEATLEKIAANLNFGAQSLLGEFKAIDAFTTGVSDVLLQYREKLASNLSKSTSIHDGDGGEHHIVEARRKTHHSDDHGVSMEAGLFAIIDGLIGRLGEMRDGLQEIEKRINNEDPQIKCERDGGVHVC